MPQTLERLMKAFVCHQRIDMNVHVVVQVIFVQKVVHPLKKFRMVIFHTHLQQNI